MRSGRRRGSWLSWFGLKRLAVPLRVVEMVMRFHEIVNREVILSVVEPRAAADDLLELDHGVDRTHQHDVADVAGIHTCRELLRCREDCRGGLIVVLKVSQVLVAERAVLGCDPWAIIATVFLLLLVD